MNEFAGYLIALARMSGIMFLIPGLGSRMLPLKFKLVLAASFALLQGGSPVATGDFVYLFIAELMIGLFLGALSRICFESLSFLASIISMKSGLAHSHFFSLGSAEQSSALYTLLFLYVSLGILDNSSVFIKAIFASYDKLPVGDYSAFRDFPKLISVTLSQSFLIAFKLSAPFVVVNALLLVASGLLSRIMQSFQLFLVLTPLQNMLMIFMFAINLDRIASHTLSALSRALAF